MCSLDGWQSVDTEGYGVQSSWVKQGAMVQDEGGQCSAWVVGEGIYASREKVTAWIARVAR